MAIDLEAIKSRQIELLSGGADASSVMQNDMVALMDALGISTHARNESPHNVMVDEVIPAVKRLATNHRWIPVAERLPPPGTLVLCFSTVPSGQWAFCFGRYVTNEFGCEFGWEKTGMTAAPVTHWMPLPEPPK